MIFRRTRFFLLFFLLFPAFFPGAAADEAEAVRTLLRGAGIPFRENIHRGDREGPSRWIWVESRPGTGEGDGGFVQSPDLLPSDAPVLGVPLSGERELPGQGVGIALELLRRRVAGGAAFSLVFFDVPGGLEEFCESLEDPEETRLLILDLGGTPPDGPVPGEAAGFVISQGARFTLAPRSVTQLLAELLEKAALPYRFGNRYNELYRLGITGGPANLETTRLFDIPAIQLGGTVPQVAVPQIAGSEIAGSQNPGGGYGDVLTALLEEFFDRVHTGQGNADFHYSIYVVGQKAFFVSEQGAVFLVVLVNGVFLALLLLSFLTRRLRMLFLLKTGLSHIWISLLYFAGLFLSLALAEGMFSLVVLVFRPVPPDGTALKLVLSVLVSLAGTAIFFLVPSRILSVVPLTKRGGFYGFNALLFASLGMLFGIYLDLTTAHFFAWILIFVALGMLREGAVFSLLCTFLSLFRPGLVLRAAAETGGEFLAGRPLLRALALAAILFPVCQSFMRSMVLVIRQRDRRQRILFPVQAAFLGLCLVLMLLWGILFRP